MLRAVSLVVAVFIALVGSAGAEPIVDLVAGAWADDDTITIFGSEFGAKNPARPILWDRVDNQPAYQQLGIGHGDVIPVRDDGCDDCPWTSQIPESWGNPIYYWTESPRVDDGAVYHFTTKGYFRFRDLGDNQPEIVYMNWWFRTSGDIHGSNKLVRSWSDSSGDYRSSWTGYHLTCDVDENHDGTMDPDSPAENWGNWGGDIGVWNNLEYICDGRGDIQHGYGRIKAITNHEVQHDVEYFGPEPYNHIYVLGLDASVSDDTRGFRFDMADIYIDKSLARVLIADQPLWSDVTHAEIQIPRSWSDGMIVVDVNRGTLDPTAQHWLYVFDPDGTHNEAGLALVAGEFPGRPPRPQRQP